MLRRLSLATKLRKGSSSKLSSNQSARIVDKEEEEALEREAIEERAVVRIQSQWRTALEPKVLTLAQHVYELAYDAESDRYFYYNRRSNESQWERPVLLGSKGMPYRSDKKAHKAAICIQTAMRCRSARAAVKARVRAVYQTEYDPETKEMYFLDKRTNSVRWEPPSKILPSVYRNSQEEDFSEAKPVGMTGDSAILYQRDREIKALKRQLEEKDQEIETVRKGRYEELGQQVRVRRVAQALKGKKRSRNIEDWRNEQVIAWFMDMDLEAYVPALMKAKVNGLLLLNLDEDDFRELGITKRLHLRQIDLALRKYRRRYEMKNAVNDLDGGDHDDDDDREENDDDDTAQLAEDEEFTYDQTTTNEDFQQVEDNDLPPNDDALPTEDEVLELQKDRKNIQIDVIFPGDENTFPDIGDIVRCHYSCKLAASGRDIENTRKNKHPFEFVLGIGQVVLGLDRGILQMSLGERSNLRISALYAYGTKGALPLVPPNSDLIFDIELLRWHRRTPWFKPLIQEEGLTQRPYEDEESYEDEDDDDEDAPIR